jgi:hypothetical protein
MAWLSRRGLSTSAQIAVAFVWIWSGLAALASLLILFYARSWVGAAIVALVVLAHYLVAAAMTGRLGKRSVLGSAVALLAFGAFSVSVSVLAWRTAVLVVIAGSSPPTAVGIVTGEERTGPTSIRYMFETRDAIELDGNAFRRLGIGIGPDVGDLLVVGRDGQGAWFAALRGGGRCFEASDPAWDADGWIVFDDGHRLPKRGDYSGHASFGRYERGIVWFCVDGNGWAVSYGPPPL